jgi:5-methylthioadenosine/S-adenosylhomocysteine deaminase
VDAPGDVVLVDLDRPHLQPMHDPIWTLVWCAGPDDVRDVVVEGRVAVRERALTGIDEGRIRQEADRAARTVAAAVAETGPASMPYAVP